MRSKYQAPSDHEGTVKCMPAQRRKILCWCSNPNLAIMQNAKNVIEDLVHVTGGVEITVLGPLIQATTVPDNVDQCPLRTL